MQWAIATPITTCYFGGIGAKTTTKGARISTATTITATASSDVADRTLSEEEWNVILPRSQGGRPESSSSQVSTTIRFDADVLGMLQATGPDWQIRVNQILREWVEAHLKP